MYHVGLSKATNREQKLCCQALWHLDFENMGIMIPYFYRTNNFIGRHLHCVLISRICILIYLLGALIFSRINCTVQPRNYAHGSQSSLWGCVTICFAQFRHIIQDYLMGNGTKIPPQKYVYKRVETLRSLGLCNIIIAMWPDHYGVSGSQLRILRWLHANYPASICRGYEPRGTASPHLSDFRVVSTWHVEKTTVCMTTKYRMYRTPSPDYPLWHALW